MAHALALLFALDVLTLDQAVDEARRHQPQLLEARAQTEVARAQEGRALAPLLPQGTLQGSFTLQYGNVSTGAPPSSTQAVLGGFFSTSCLITGFSECYRVSLGVSQLLWDFGTTLDAWRATKETVRAQLDTEEQVRQLVLQNVRAAYFLAQQDKALVVVAQQTLDNQQKHLDQIQGFVTVGTRPEIDLAQAKADRANARVQLITAQNNYETAKAQLNQAMGVERSTEYEVAEGTLPPVEGEDRAVGALVDEAVANRPDLASIDRQLRAQELAISSAKGAYWPAFGTSTSVSESGLLGSNGGHSEQWQGLLSAQWSFFQGGLTRATVRQNEAQLANLEAQREALRLQVRFDVEQARLAVRAAKASVVANQEFVENAKERLRLAEGRYQTGVGSVIELGDAQVQATQASAQLVGAEEQLATARAQLLRALGRR